MLQFAKYVTALCLCIAAVPAWAGEQSRLGETPAACTVVVAEDGESVAEVRAGFGCARA
jgi:hypothetical protein